MRRVWLPREDFGLFHQDISPYEFEFFRSHSGAFKRMWHEQSRKFWSLFVSAFDYFLWNHGIMKDFPMTEEEAREYVDEIMKYIRDQFVEGRFTTAKALIMDCVVVAQNRNCILLLERANYSQSPFVMKETREVFRQLFGPPTNKRTFMKVLCGLPVYVKFAGAAVSCLRRWLTAETIPSDEKLEAEFLASVHRRPRGSSDYNVIGCTEDLLKVVGRLQPPSSSSSSLDKPKTVSKSGRVKSSDAAIKAGGGGEEEERGEGEGEGEKGDGGSGKKKKRKKKKKVSSSEAEEKEGGDKEPVSRCGSRENKDKEDEIKEDEKLKTEGEKAKEVECDENKVEENNERDGEKQSQTAAGSEEAEREKSEGATSGPTSPTDSGIGSGVEHVAMETPARLPTKSRGGAEKVELAGEQGVAGEKEPRRRKLHTCACCGEGETVAKTFKRCQKCRGLPNPNYYCSRECQAKHWKEHKLDHRDDRQRGESAH